MLYGVREGVHPHRFPIKVRPDPGVDGEFMDGIAVVKVQQGGPLLGRGYPHPGLDGYLDGQVGGEDPVKKVRHLLRQGEKAGTFLLGDHRAGGTAQVQVYLPIPKILEHPGGGQESLRLVGEKLRDHRDALVVLRQHVGEAPAGQGAVHRGGPEGGIIGVHAGKHGKVGRAVHPAGDALQGCERNGHRNLP